MEVMKIACTFLRKAEGKEYTGQHHLEDIIFRKSIKIALKLI
jgi:hypothetical protein